MSTPSSKTDAAQKESMSPWTSWRILTPLVILAIMGSLVSLILWPQWRHNPDLSHGLFMPIIFAVLLHESRAHGTKRLMPDSSWVAGTLLAFLGIGLLVLSLGGLYALAMGWSHNIPCMAVALAFFAFGIATLIAFARRSAGLWWFNWPAVAAFGLWILCAPFPPGLWARLTMRLQMGVTTSVLQTLHLIGIPAAQHGNIIELAHTSVGVEEACSGVRSLISCLFAGVFFSACMVRRTSSRILLIVLSCILAISMNYLRSLLLTLLANKGVVIEGTWHDLTGFGILGITAVLLAVLAAMLSRLENARSSIAGSAEQKSQIPATGSWNLMGLSGGLGLGILIAAVLFIVSKPAEGIRHKIPDLEAILPTQAEGWQVISAPDLLRFSEVLQTDKMVQRDYVRVDADGTTQVTIYLAYWSPGQSNPSQVALHTPDGCWPGSGWSRLPFAPERSPLDTSRRQLPEAEQRLFSNEQGFQQYVWYWHLYDGHPIVQLNPYEVGELLQMALQYGFDRSGDQLFVRISSNRPWSTISHDPLISDIFQNLKQYGL